MKTSFPRSIILAALILTTNFQVANSAEYDHGYAAPLQNSRLNIEFRDNQTRFAKFAAGGTRVVTEYGNAVLVWNTETGEQTRQIVAFNGNISHIEAASKSPIVAGINSSEGTLKVFNTDTYNLVREFKGLGRTRKINLDENSKTVSAININMILSKWNYENGTLINTFSVKVEGPRFYAFSPYAPLYATANKQGEVTIWNTDTGNVFLKNSLLHSEDKDSAFAFSPNGKEAVISSDTGIYIWNFTKNEFKYIFSAPCDVEKLAFDYDGNNIAATTNCSRDIGARLINLKSGKVTQVLKGHTQISDINFSEDGRQLVAAGDGKVKIYLTPEYLSQEKKNENEQFSSDYRKSSHDLEIGSSLSLSPDGTKLASMNYMTVYITDFINRKVLKSFTFPDDGAFHLLDESKTGFSSDGKTLVTYFLDGFLRFWDVETGKQYREIRVNNRLSPSSFAIGADNTVAVLFTKRDTRFGENTNVPTGNGDAYIEIQNISNGKVLSKTKLLQNKYDLWQVYKNIIYDSKSNRAVVCDEHTLQVYDTKKGKLIATLEDDFLLFYPLKGCNLALSSDGHYLAVSDRSYVKVWNLNNYEKIHQENVLEANQVAFNPTNNLLYYSQGYNDNDYNGITVLNIFEKKEVAGIYNEYAHGVGDFVFSRDGETFLTVTSGH